MIENTWTRGRVPLWLVTCSSTTGPNPCFHQNMAVCQLAVAAAPVHWKRGSSDLGRWCVLCYSRSHLQSHEWVIVERPPADGTVSAHVLLVQTELGRMNRLSAVKTNTSAQLSDKKRRPRSWEDHRVRREMSTFCSVSEIWIIFLMGYFFGLAAKSMWFFYSEWRVCGFWAGVCTKEKKNMMSPWTWFIAIILFFFCIFGHFIDRVPCSSVYHHLASSFCHAGG